jgi:hypothetical protein
MTVRKRRYTMTARATKAQETRDQIRESAIAIYCERPIGDFTLEDVARRAGTTVQTVLRAVLDWLADGLLQQSFLEPGGSSGALLPAAVESLLAGASASSSTNLKSQREKRPNA